MSLTGCVLMFLLSYHHQVGDRVVALPEFKAWAELVAVPTKYVYPIPDNMTFSDATAVAINFVVAHILLFDLAAIRPGKSLLLHSAGGGVVSLRMDCTVYFRLLLLSD